ncbi:MAG: hypothetical protein JXA21_07030 [Anaerolineae bacterium]|nr:hypothetical protein [Anaerolineae bacterium]
MSDLKFMKEVSSTEIIRDWGTLTLEAVKAQAPVLVTNMRRPYLVVLPYDAYAELVEKAEKAQETL